MSLSLAVTLWPVAHARAEDASAPPPEAPVPAIVEVTVREHSKVRQMRESARAVDVIDLTRDRRHTADLGSVLARTEGVSVRRLGALGADARLSLNGLTDEQVKVFIDGVPLELAGYPFGVQNIPVELLTRIDVHRGVVPLRLGSDALGGAVELIGDEGTRGTHAHASYQAGSFDTHRLLASGRHYVPSSGAFVRAEGFLDSAQNDYPIRVSQQTPLGLKELTVRRNNDDYRAGFGSVEGGFVHRPWAKKLLLRAFFGDMDKGIPSDPLMRVSYGRVRAGRRAAGTLLRYESAPVRGFTAALTAGFNQTDTTLRDLASCSYDWVGACTNDRTPSRGERERAADLRVTQRSGLARLLLNQALAAGHVLRLGVSPTFTRRTGEDRAIPAGDLDELSGERDLLTVLSGLEYQADILDERLQLLGFAKYYFMRAKSQAVLDAGGLLALNLAHHRAGGGAALRFRVTDALYVKGSYEYATRLPAPDQLYGDAAQLIDANLRLSPESAHNGNLSVTLDQDATSVGALRGQLALFARRVDDLIFLFTTPTARKYENVERATAVGVEGNVGFTSPGRWISLDANATYQDYRNRAQSGQFAAYQGARMANQPYLFANLLAQLFARGLMPEGDELSLSYRASYVHNFIVGWENANPGGLKLRVPAQLVHGMGVALLLARGKATIGAALELHNLTNARVYDYLGVQLPGRMVAAKVTMGF